jgi:guanine deaminase
MSPSVPSQSGPVDPYPFSVFPSDDDMEFLGLAVDLALRNVISGGGPFGAVVVRDGIVLGMGTNEVAKSFDPVGHAEIVALRAACRRLARTDLIDCVLYANCEPCPLCLTACRWASLPRVVHASSRASALATGYADELHYETLDPVSSRELLIQQAWLENAGEPFAAWREACRSS